MSLTRDIDRYQISERSRSFKFAVAYSGKFRVSVNLEKRTVTLQKFNAASNYYKEIHTRHVENAADFSREDAIK
jgi:hypothetical protein